MTNKRYMDTDNDRRPRCSTRHKHNSAMPAWPKNHHLCLTTLRSSSSSKLHFRYKTTYTVWIRYRSRTRANKSHFPQSLDITHTLSSETPYLFQYGKPKEMSLMYMIRYPSTFRSHISGHNYHDIHKHVRFGPCHSHCCHPVGRRWRFRQLQSYLCEDWCT